MSLNKRLQRRWRYWLDRNARRAQLQDEMEHHLALLAQQYMEVGMPAAEARTKASQKFGNVTQQAEEACATWISRWLTDTAQDLRYTARILRRDAGFTTFAILIVGLGIGASSTVFGVVNALLLRPLPFHDSARLIWLANDASEPDETFQAGTLLDFRAQSTTVADLAGYFAFYGTGDVKLTGSGEPERLTGVKVTQNFFPLIGVEPFIGRNFTAEECRQRWDDLPAVLLSYSIWQRRFASDPRIVGRKLLLNEAPAIVTGVLPASFDFATVFAPGARIDVFVPFPLTEQAHKRGNTLAVVGRLRPGATVASARTEFDGLCREIRRRYPDRNELHSRLTSLAEHVNGRLRPAIVLLVCAVTLVMLIVCANLSNLQLARAASRQREIAVRVALGAGRSRLIRQMLTESVLLASAGAMLGFILTIAGTRVLSHLEAVNIPLLSSVRVDAVTLIFTLLAAALTGILCGLVPALQMPDLAVHDTLKDSGRAGSESRRRSWLRGTLAVVEIALACVLVVGAGLLIRSFLRVLDIHLGFHPERAVALRIDPNSRYSTQVFRNNYYSDALRRVRSISGVQGAGLTDVLPLAGDRSWGVGAKGQLYDQNHYHETFVRIVSDGYFHAMGMSLKAGRDFTEYDDDKSRPVIIINESLARTLWPHQNPIGQVLLGAGYVDREVIGVVGDVRHLALEQASGNEMYLAMRQTRDYAAVDLVVRSSLASSQLAPALRAALTPIEPDLPASEFRTIQQLVDKAISPRRFIVYLLTGFSAFALILASLGIYGVISYSVSRRIQEIGIRMALGASAWDVQWRIVGQTLGLAAIGMTIGTAASWLLTGVISGMLYGVSAADPLTFTGMLAVLTSVAALAGYLPARRASRIDPMRALRTN